MPFAGDEGDFCYVKDCALGLFLLQTAKEVKHPFYNIGGGEPRTNGDLVAAAKAVAPSLQCDLREGKSPNAKPSPWMDISWAKEDVGYVPEYNLERGVAEYIDWLHENPV